MSSHGPPSVCLCALTSSSSEDTSHTREPYWIRAIYLTSFHLTTSLKALYLIAVTLCGTSRTSACKSVGGGTIELITHPDLASCPLPGSLFMLPRVHHQTGRFPLETTSAQKRQVVKPRLQEESEGILPPRTGQPGVADLTVQSPLTCLESLILQPARRGRLGRY